MRRLAVAAFAAAMILAPGATGAAFDCAVTVAHASAAAPLRVTFTTTCASANYQWSFGDNEEGQGQTVEHVYSAGLWHPTLTTDAGTQALAPVTAISVSLTGPATARYAAWVTLHAAVTPNLPVTVRGRPVAGGKIRFRVLSPAPYVAFANGVR